MSVEKSACLCWNIKTDRCVEYLGNLYDDDDFYYESRIPSTMKLIEKKDPMVVAYFEINSEYIKLITQELKKREYLVVSGFGRYQDSKYYHIAGYKPNMLKFVESHMFWFVPSCSEISKKNLWVHSCNYWELQFSHQLSQDRILIKHFTKLNEKSLCANSQIVAGCDFSDNSNFNAKCIQPLIKSGFIDSDVSISHITCSNDVQMISNLVHNKLTKSICDINPNTIRDFLAKNFIVLRKESPTNITDINLQILSTHFLACAVNNAPLAIDYYLMSIEIDDMV